MSKHEQLHRNNMSWTMENRITELLAIQKEAGLSFYRLDDEKLGVMRGRVILICNQGIQMSQVSFEQMPEEFKAIKERADGAYAAELDETRAIFIRSDLIDAETGRNQTLGIGLIVPQQKIKTKGGSGNVSIIRSLKGSGVFQRMYEINAGESLFVVANKVSLTAKQGYVDDMKERGLKFPKEIPILGK